MSKLAEKLKEFKMERGLTNGIIAQNVGTTETSVARFIKGSRTPVYPVFIKLLYYFDCSADYLLGADDIPTTEPLHDVLPFGARLRAIMQTQNIIQDTMIEEMEISSSALYKWLSGKSLPSTDSLLRIANYLECSVDYLIGRRR